MLTEALKCIEDKDAWQAMRMSRKRLLNSNLSLADGILASLPKIIAESSVQ